MNAQVLAHIFPFGTDEIDTSNYTASLLHLCVIHHCISPSRQQTLRQELDALLIETALQYTSRASTTLPRKIMEQLYSSVLYQCDTALRSLNSLPAAVDALCATPAADLASRGTALLLNAYQASVPLFRRVWQTRLSLPLEEYHNVIHRTFDRFYAEYDGRFDARNTVVAIDYPLLTGNWFDECGVLYINRYYTCLLLENEFCNLFPLLEIHQILTQYGRIYQSDYRHLLFNLAEVVRNNALAAGLAGMPPRTLMLQPAQLEVLYARYAGCSAPQLLKQTELAFRPYYKLITDPAAALYFRRTLPAFSNTLYRHLAQHTLHHFLCT